MRTGGYTLHSHQPSINEQAGSVASMATIAEFSIPATEFALRETLERRPNMVFEVDRVVANATDSVVPYVTATQGEFEGLTSLLETDETVEEVELLADTEEECLYRMEWTQEARIVGYMVVEQGATVENATAKNGQWYLRVLFPERKGLQAVDEYARESGYSLNLTQIYGIDAREQARFELTDEQRDALVMAVENGYYQVPRDVSQEDLADELDISHQALSERLRRATENMAKNALRIEEDATAD
ncbi:helix-turn-helix domain-containing protein [Halococcus salifodinae]|nr:bacterio-opsin activator domain-containing protein [Halococcus salifodinae]